MDKLTLAIETLEAANEARIKASASAEVDDVELAQDIILADLARRACLDHQRLAKLEAMMAFFFKKNVVEGRRRPSPAEASALGEDVSNFVTTRTWLKEFEAQWPAALRSEASNEQE